MATILQSTINNDYNNSCYKYPPRLQTSKQKEWFKMGDETKSKKSYDNIVKYNSRLNNWSLIMNRFRKSDVFTDVTLCNTIRAHKCFLAAKSKYFEKLFTNESNKNKDKFDFPNISDDAMNIVVDFIYTNEINVDKNNAEEVLIAAGEIQIEELISYCQDICNKQIDKSKRLRSENIVSKNYKELYLFGGLSWSRKEGYITPPTEIYNLNESSRQNKEQYLTTIDNKRTLNRFGNALAKFGNTVYAIGGQNHDEILNTIESIEINSLTSSWKKTTANFCFNSKYLESVTINDKVYLFGVNSNEYRNKNFHKMFYCLDLNSLTMNPLSSLPINLYTPSPVAVDNTIYVVGDDIDNSVQTSWIRKKSFCEEGSKFFRIDTRLKDWESLPSTEYRKFEGCMILFNNTLYCVGGGYPHTCEIFDIRGNRWKEMANSTSASYYSKLILLDGKIHKIGHSCFNEMYEPTIDEWIKTEKIRYPRFGFNITTI